MIDMLSATPDLWGVFSQSDAYVPGIIAAMKESERLHPAGHKNHIVYVSIDGNPVALPYIREGYIDVTMDQNPYAMGCVVAKGVLMVANGLGLPEFPDNNITTDVIPITVENVDDPSLWGNFGVPKEKLWPRTQEFFEYYKWQDDEKIYR